MSSDSKTEITQHISPTELNDRIRKYEKCAKTANRLQFIQQIYEGHSVAETCRILKMPVRTGYNWKKKWDDEGPDGLEHKKGAGRPPFLTQDQFKEVDDYIKNNDSLGTRDVHQFILREYKIDYSSKQVREIIKKLEYGWSKPYPIYSKSPKKAKKILKKLTSEIDPDKDIYGFFDESAFQNLPNYSRVLKKNEKNTK